MINPQPQLHSRHQNIFGVHTTATCDTMPPSTVVERTEVDGSNKYPAARDFRDSC